MNYPVLLSGGTGKRLWPLSRASRPKQFLKLFSDSETTLFQASATRLHADPEFCEPLVFCSSNQRFAVAEQLAECGVEASRIFLEPQSRNTGPAVVTAALAVAAEDPEGILIVMPTDQLISDKSEFRKIIIQAITLATDGHFVTFGIVPDEPHTGYGYIRRGKPVSSGGATGFHVDAFIEKPDRERAEQFLKSGNYFWNSGIFVLPVAELLKAAEIYQPDMLTSCGRALSAVRKDLAFFRLGEAEYCSAPDISLDYSIMERCNNIVTLPLKVDWKDIGSWISVGGHLGEDEAGNSVVGRAVLNNSTKCIVHAGDRLVAGLGLHNLLIVDAPGALLVAAKDETQEVHRIVDMLQNQGYSEAVQANRHYRPWGWFEIVSGGPGFQVKKVRVKPGGKLSLQRHSHRSEHWVVVRGTARVTRGESKLELGANESVYVPSGEWHCLENPGTMELEIIEIQIGDYLEEDDIERAEDEYGRADDGAAGI